MDAKGRTDVGLVRSVNQDSYYLNSKEGLFIVADGMGGHAGGEIASQLATQVISSHLQKKLAHKSANVHEFQFHIEEAIHQASTRIYDKSLENPELKGMGTTVTVAQIVDSHAFVGQVGDSRLYLIRSGFIYQITNDHSLVSEQVRAGKLSPEDAEKHKLKNIITRCVGYQEKELVDTFVVSLENNDILILCSDGLHGKLNDREIIHDSLNAKNPVETLVEKANSRGGEDNITCILVKWILSKDDKP